MSYLYASISHYVKDAAWFDELELKGWDSVRNESY